MAPNPPTDPEPPTPPRLPTSPRSEVDRDVDPDFPDLDELDLDGVELSFPSARVVTLDGVRVERVDLRGADLTAVTDVGVLRGATISEVQAITLAGRLAGAAGIHVAPAP